MGFFTVGTCAHCHAPLSVQEKAMNGLRPPDCTRCRACKIKASKALRRFAHEFRLACEDDVITSEEWQSLWVKLQPSGVTRDEALAYIRQDAIKFLDHLIEMTFADGVATLEEEAHFRRMIATLEVCPKDMANLRVKWDNAQNLSTSQNANT
ncbi:hypothetical protein EON80_16495 [bacterium]|nr:MAG: hypothetical protein EON80_16495 [bacterium]